MGQTEFRQSGHWRPSTAGRKGQVAATVGREATHGQKAKFVVLNSLPVSWRSPLTIG
jgi:hypothetical protein